MSKMLWVGLTGGIATGKSSVAQILKKKSQVVVDADKLAHQALQIGSNAYHNILQYFGPGIVGLDKSIDRKKLGEIVFADKEKLLKLESFVHPEVKRLAQEQRKLLSDQHMKLAFYDVPLLFEKKMQKDFDYIVLVYAPKETQLERLKSRNHLSDTEANLRIQNQIPIDEKIGLADRVIYNTSSVMDLEVECDKLIQELNQIYQAQE